MLRCPDGLCHVILDVLVAPWRENNILDFSRSSMKIESEQNTVSTAAPSLSDISSAMKGVILCGF